MRLRRAWAGSVLALAPWLACAAAVKLQAIPAVDLTNTPPRLTVGVWNEGTDPVRDVEVEAVSGAWTGRSPAKVHTIGPDESRDYTLTVSPLPPGPGKYPVVVRTRYTDREGRRFSMVTPADIVIGGIKPDLWMTPTLDSAKIVDSARLTLRMASLEDAPLAVSVRLVLPDEFTCPHAERRITLAPDAENLEVFDIVNRTGVSGSSYTVLAVLESETGGMHRTDTASGTLWVDTPALMPARRYVVWFGVGMALAVLLMAMPKRSGGTS
jgi:hypothetical protein